jgi:NAD(P)-dependent dehydrogenase (short-subunit alcohol dehydrogenase family)
MRLQDKVAIVTGSGSGLGKAIVKRLAEEGAAVVVADFNQEAMDTVVRELERPAISSRSRNTLRCEKGRPC